MNKSIAIIPLRKGSKGIPGKNKKKLLGRPLYQWIIGAAIHSNLSEVYIFTDDEDIIEHVNSFYKWTPKIKVWPRSKESATDTASTEYAMYELAVALNFDFDTYCLLQATSALTTSDDINNVLEKVITGESDSALTVVKTKRFVWSQDGRSLNYDYMNRPRRQDFDGMLIENGAVYAINKRIYQESKNRLGGKIGVIEMPEDTLHEIDEPSDWFTIEQILINRLKLGKRTTDKVKMLVLDVDGVFTPGTVGVSGNGELFKLFSLRDGMGFEIAREAGLEIVVMTSEDSPIVDQRMEKLKLREYYKWAKDKYSLLTKICIEHNLTRGEVAYIGDDINDLANLLSVGWSMAPSDAIDSVKQQVDLVLHSSGGDKAIREGIEFIINYNKRIK